MTKLCIRAKTTFTFTVSTIFHVGVRADITVVVFVVLALAYPQLEERNKLNAETDFVHFIYNTVYPIVLSVQLY